MADASLNRRRKLSVRTKVLFASGALQEAVVTAGGIATVLFYNQLLGVSPALVGTALSNRQCIRCTFRSAYWRHHRPFSQQVGSSTPVHVCFSATYWHQFLFSLSTSGWPDRKATLFGSAYSLFYCGCRRPSISSHTMNCRTHRRL